MVPAARCLFATSLKKGGPGFLDRIVRQPLIHCIGSANFNGTPDSQENFARRGFPLRFQFAFRPQPIVKVVAGVAAPVQIKLVSTMLDRFWVRIMFAVGTLLVLIFVMFHILYFLFLGVIFCFSTLWPPLHPPNIPCDCSDHEVQSRNPVSAATHPCILAIA